NPDVNLSIEPPQPKEDQVRPPSVIWIDAFDPEFIEGHPDLTVAEYAAFMELVNEFTAKVKNGEIVDRATYLETPYDFEAAVSLITSGAEHLRKVCAEEGLALQP